tara:strand:- start:134 stop:634 length:501 start_codon:yes stop_codon:yes gene_type:complete
METKNIITKIHEAKNEIEVVAKNATNPHFKNTYADINALIAAVEPILLDKGLLLLQPIRDGKQYTIIYDTESGESVESCLALNSAMKPQDQGSAITYFRRYTLQGLLCLMSDDDDGNKTKDAPPVFLISHFANYHKQKVKIETIRQKAIVSVEVEAAYIKYCEENK